MKISYNWLKWYIPEIPEAEKMWDIFTYHLCEVESIEKIGEGDMSDTIFDINILPNRAHDLLSHQGIARELASLLDIAYVDPTLKYKIPQAKNTNLEIKIESKNCRRYTARIVRNVKVGPSPEWVVNHLASIGQRSINNIVDAANIVMYDCGQPIHAFDLDKLSGGIVVREARDGEEITTLDNKQVKLKTSNMVIADEKNVLAIAGVKGGKIAEVDENTKNIVIEIANFDPVSVRKTARGINIFTDAAKRFENDLSPELCDFAMLEMSGLLLEYGFTDFEDVVDIYPNKQIQRKLSFSLEKMSKILGIEVSTEQVEDILKRYNFEYSKNGDIFEIVVPAMRLDLIIEEDIAEEIGRVLGYDKVIPKIPKINLPRLSSGKAGFTPKKNETYEMMQKAREYLLAQGYNEVMTYTFVNKGEVEVLASASDKKFLRTNLSDGLKESIKQNIVNLPLFDAKEIKVFEIGNVFLKDKEEMRVVYGDKKEVKEMNLEEFCQKASPDAFAQVLGSPREDARPDHSQKHIGSAFKMWSLFPFITRDIAVWVPEAEGKDNLEKLLRENMTELCVKGPDVFDSFTKPASPEGGSGKTSYGFRMVFQSYEKTLTDIEINEIMQKITDKVKENKNWEVR